MRRRDLAFETDRQRRGVVELRTHWGSRPSRIQWLVPPRPVGDHGAGCCGASFVRLDVGEIDRSPVRWALWRVDRGTGLEPLSLQAASGAGWLSLATSFPCQPGGAGGLEPIEGLFAAFEGLADPPAAKDSVVIGRDSAWNLEDWSLPHPRHGRDQWLLGIGTLGTAALAIPLHSALQIAEASIAWALAAGFTGLGYLFFARIQQRIARPSREAKDVADSLAHATPVPEVWGPRTASPFALPVVVHRDRGRRIGYASATSTLLRARSAGAELRIVVRSVKWPDRTDRRCRLVPEQWMAAELRGKAAPPTDAWLRKEVSEEVVRTVVSRPSSGEALARALGAVSEPR